MAAVSAAPVTGPDGVPDDACRVRLALYPDLLLSERRFRGPDPSARVVFGPDGHLYGTTTFGGTTGVGVVFALTPPLSICKTLSCLWKENVLHTFLGAPADGATPNSGDLVWGQQGNFYGTTGNGGTQNQGTAFQINPGNNTYSVIYNFKGAHENDGGIPNGSFSIKRATSMAPRNMAGGSRTPMAVFRVDRRQRLDGNHSLQLYRRCSVPLHNAPSQ